MLNAEMILKRGIKPENLYIKTEIHNAIGDITWSIYDDKSKELIGQLTLPAIASNCFSGKIFKPIYILNDEEVDKEAWAHEKEAHNDND